VRVLPLLAAALVTALLSGRAGADTAAEHDARALFNEGKALVGRGDYAGALDRFQRAYASAPNVKILLNIATMYRELGRGADAANAYQRYLRDPAAAPAKKAEVAPVLAELDRHLGLLRIEVQSPDLRPRLDGRLDREPGELGRVRVEPGSHAVTAERGGVTVVTEIVVVAAGEMRVVTLRPPVAVESVAAGPVATPRPAADTVGPPPGLTHRGQLGAVARADIDGRGRGVAGAFGLSFGVGDHVELSASALVGRDKGVEPALTVLVLQGAVKPRLSAGVPIFFVDGPRPGARIGAGVEWDPIRYFGAFAEAAVSFFPSAPHGYDHVVFIPNAGVQARVF